MIVRLREQPEPGKTVVTAEEYRAKAERLREQARKQWALAETRQMLLNPYTPITRWLKGCLTDRRDQCGTRIGTTITSPPGRLSHSSGIPGVDSGMFCTQGFDK